MPVLLAPQKDACRVFGIAAGTRTSFSRYSRYCAVIRHGRNFDAAFSLQASVKFQDEAKLRIAKLG
jgi:hypothetical protein